MLQNYEEKLTYGNIFSKNYLYPTCYFLYAKPINKPKKGIYCEVEFIETHRCTELFFLYYFRYTSRPYDEQEPLLKDLNQCVEYRKTIEFFIKTKGLHSYFERNGGSLEKAIANANQSVDEKLKDGRDYTYKTQYLAACIYATQR